MYVLMDECMVITYTRSRVWTNRVTVANPARSKLNKENRYVSPMPVRALRNWSRETGLTVSSRVSLLSLHTHRLDLLLRGNTYFPPVPVRAPRNWFRETGSTVSSMSFSLLSLHTRGECVISANSQDYSRLPRQRPFIYLHCPTPSG